MFGCTSHECGGAQVLVIQLLQANAQACWVLPGWSALMRAHRRGSLSSLNTSRSALHVCRVAFEVACNSAADSLSAGLTVSRETCCLMLDTPTRFSHPHNQSHGTGFTKQQAPHPSLPSALQQVESDPDQHRVSVCVSRRDNAILRRKANPAGPAAHRHSPSPLSTACAANHCSAADPG